MRINGAKVDPKTQHVINPGDRIEMITPGGGGYGPEAERDPQARAEDERDGYVARAS